MVFKAEYVLDKSYLSECYEQSLPYSQFSTIRFYVMGMVFTVLGIVSWRFWQINGFIASALVTIGVLQIFSTYFKKPWWLFRQSISKSGKKKVTLTIVEGGLSTSSTVHSFHLKWKEVADLQETPKGLIFTPTVGPPMYVSKSILNDEVVDFIKSSVNGA